MASNMADSWDSSEVSGSEGVSWITWFCSLPGHEFFCEVQEEFIEDEFNLTGLRGMFPYYEEAIATIMDLEIEDESLSEQEATTIEAAAAMLYGMIHQRFIISRQGLRVMYEKYERGDFGRCPRVNCLDTAVLPCGLADTPRTDTVKLYCPNCRDIYHPPHERHRNIDGAYFGTTFPHLFMMTFENMLPPLPNPSEIYIPRIFGFRVSEKSPAGPHMTWLRARFDSTPNEASSDDESMVEEGTATETQDATINKDDQMDVDADGHATNNRTNLAVNTPVQKR